MAEILSPCGSIQAVEAALGCGCDAIYVGSEVFSARQNAKNFSYDELRQTIEECHKNGVKVYQAINTLFFDSQLDDVVNELKNACELGIDAIITQDLGICYLVRRLCPTLPIHASTQMSLHTKNGVLLARELGFVRAVVSRELSLEALKTLCETDVEIEAFVHGALCMSVSGQCYMSALIGSRSANRGLCAQACRLPFSACGNGSCDLSLKDMSHIKSVKELEKIGVASLKIEGRMKRPEYVAAATNACRLSLDGKEYDDGLLRAVFSRSGFTDGYLTGRLGRDMFGTREKEDVTSAKDAFPKLHELYRKPYKRFSLRFDAVIKENEPVLLTATSSDGVSATVYGDKPEKAINRPLTRELLEKQLSRLGSTIYTLDSATCQIDDGITVSPSALNELRRRACEELDSIRTSSKVRATFTPCQIEKPRRFWAPHQSIRLDLSYAWQLEGVDFDGVELVSLPISEFKKLDRISDKLSAYMPRFDFDEEKTAQLLSELCDKGLRHITATNLSHIYTARGKDLTIHGDFGLNVTNSYSAQLLSELGVSDIVGSFELTAKQLCAISSPAAMGAIVYGRLPSMLTVNCPVKQAVGCKNCTGRLEDRTGRSFEINCCDGYVEVLNSEPLYLADKLSDFSALSFVTMKFHKEKPKEISQIIKDYKLKAEPCGKITRGLYYRGII